MPTSSLDWDIRSQNNDKVAPHSFEKALLLRRQTNVHGSPSLASLLSFLRFYSQIESLLQVGQKLILLHLVPASPFFDH